MKCPQCEKEGKRSRVYVGQSYSTLLGWTPYYDEDGNWINNDPNTTTTSYHCSEGHFFNRVTRSGEVTVVEIPDGALTSSQDVTATPVGSGGVVVEWVYPRSA